MSTPVNAGSISSLATAASALSNTATGLTNALLATPNVNIGYQPQSPASLFNQISTPPTIIFNYEGEQDVTLESDITDNYVEDNTTLQDNIALRPVMISTNGFVGELNDVVPSALQTLKQVADSLIPIEAYAPALTITALNAYNLAQEAYQTAAAAAAAASSALTSLNGGNTGVNILNQSTLINLNQIQSKQQLYFTLFYGYWLSRTLFTVQTPWAIFSNCAIQSLKALQDEKTNLITDFTVKFKVVNFAQTVITGPNGVQIQQGQLSSQASPTSNYGNTPLGPSTAQVFA